MYMRLKDIKKMPTVLEEVKTHESVLRSFHIARKLMEMIERGDSKETIKEVFEFLST